MLQKDCILVRITLSSQGHSILMRFMVGHVKCWLLYSSCYRPHSCTQVRCPDCICHMTRISHVPKQYTGLEELTVNHLLQPWIWPSKLSPESFCMELLLNQNIIKDVWYSKTQNMSNSHLMPLFTNNKSNCFRNRYSTHCWKLLSYYVSYSCSQAYRIGSQNTI